MESRHVVHAAACATARSSIPAGDPELVTFLRSVREAVPGAAARLDVPTSPDDELAIACASHDGAPEHLAAVRALLARAGSREDDLECGPEHGASSATTARASTRGCFLARAAGLAVGGLPPAGPPAAAGCSASSSPRRSARTPRTSTRPSTAAACRPSPRSLVRDGARFSRLGRGELRRARTPSCGR